MDELMVAVRAGDVAGVAAALDAGADPRLGEPPPLVVAAERGPLAMVELLISRGAPEFQHAESGPPR